MNPNLMADKPEVTIVVPTRNRCALLEETVASVFSQTIDNWELIVIDDASNDETWSWLQGLDDARVKPLRLAQHSERAKARNLGLQSAKGPFVLFLDDDDLLPERALQTHLEALRKYPAAVSSIGGYLMFDENGPRRVFRLMRHDMVRPIEQDILFEWMAVSGQCLFRTNLIKSINGWDEVHDYIPAEDHDLWLRVARLGPAVLLPDIALHYRTHSAQWRPANLRQKMTEIRARAVSQMQGQERDRAERILRARALVQRASEHYERAEAFRALLLDLKALWEAPSLLQSPLTRPLVLVPMMKCLTRIMGVRVEEFLISFVRQIMRERAIKKSDMFKVEI